MLTWWLTIWRIPGVSLVIMFTCLPTFSSLSHDDSSANNSKLITKVLTIIMAISTWCNNICIPSQLHNQWSRVQFSSEAFAVYCLHFLKFDKSNRNRFLLLFSIIVKLQKAKAIYSKSLRRESNSWALVSCVAIKFALLLIKVPSQQLLT